MDTELLDGETADFGGGAPVIATPGPSDGSVAIHVPGANLLFTGRRVRESLVKLAHVPAETTHRRLH